MSTSGEKDISEGRAVPFKWLGLESINPEADYLNAEDEFFAWAVHRQMEIRRATCQHIEQEMALLKMCGCDCDEVPCG